MEEINPLKIKSAMIESGITQVRLAKEMGLSRSAVTHFFNKKNNTGWKTLNKIIRAFNKLKAKEIDERY